MNKFMQLKSGEIHWSTLIREYLKEHETKNQCIYCGSEEKLTLEHILPTCKGGPDDPDNAIMVCKSCNSSKGGKKLYEWKGLESKDEHHRIAEGRYLKLLFKLHEQRGTLDVCNVKDLCPKCDMEKICERDGKKGKLSVYCLEGTFQKSG